ncbi:MAG: symmetrical bis(5'-nucleosyl)-tetraphosphatase [Deltaproteobacteria bacterium]|nr:symmetrical bis(5'-nucleosyl)-tetraphosphatase [Deltaproteobacteria bacterium]
MATYVIGDVHGHLRPLQRLLARLRFDRGRDELWFVGDLVNRGPDSLGVLRLVEGLGQNATVVLGNHDLHLLARALAATPAKPKDTLDAVLAAADRERLVAWLRSRPLLVRRPEAVMVHAGLLPQWSLDTAVALAHEAEAALQSATAVDLLALYTRSRAGRWSSGLTGLRRLVVVLNALTRLRVLTLDGRMQLDFSGPLAEVPTGCRPWYAHPRRRSRGPFVVFGHWAAHGFACHDHEAAMDSGCAWGGSLSALRLEDRRQFTVPVPATRRRRE